MICEGRWKASSGSTTTKSLLAALDLSLHKIKLRGTILSITESELCDVSTTHYSADTGIVFVCTKSIA